MSDKDKDKDGRETKVTLLSEDGIKFPVSLQVVRCIGLFRNLLELHAAAGHAASTLPTLQVPNVTSLILDKIVEYLDNYVSAREFSTVTRKRASDEGKTTVAHIVSSVKKDSVANDDDYDDDDGDHLPDGRGGSPAEETLDDGEFDVISDDEDVFDFANYDEQRLCLFTPYEQNFFASLDIPTIIEITKAANFMHIPHLLDCCCKAIANHMKGLTVEELRVKFNIKNDFTPEEEERVRRETAWVEE